MTAALDHETIIISVHWHVTCSAYMVLFGSLDELIMSSSCTSKTNDYYYQMRQKNNEAARNSRFKKKVAEIEISVQKRKLEVTYVQLKKEIKRIQIVKAS
ncbi:hypothetical protein QTP88_011646 [Uroleucon formosanum]